MAAYSPLTLSVLFDGVAALPGESVSWGDNNNLDIERTQAMTWNIWIKTTANGGAIWTKQQTSRGWGLHVFNSAGDFLMRGPRNNLDPFDNRTLVSGGAPKINDGNWHMLSVVSDGGDPLLDTDMHLFIDGSEMTGGQRTFGGSMAATSVSNADMMFANEATQLANFGGNICHPSAWNVAATAAQIAELYGGVGVPQVLIDGVGGSKSITLPDPVFWNPCGNGDGLGAGGFIDLANSLNGTHNNLESGDFVSDFPGFIPGNFKGSLFDFPAYASAPFGTVFDGSVFNLGSSGDVQPPTIGNFVPSVGTPIKRSDAIQFDVLDNLSSLRRAEIFVTLDGETYVVHDGEKFRGQFSNLSTRTPIAGGFRFIVRRNGGWTTPPTFEVHATDTSGNEAI